MFQPFNKRIGCFVSVYAAAPSQAKATPCARCVGAILWWLFSSLNLSFRVFRTGTGRNVCLRRRLGATRAASISRDKSGISYDIAKWFGVRNAELMKLFTLLVSSPSQYFRRAKKLRWLNSTHGSKKKCFVIRMKLSCTCRSQCVRASWDFSVRGNATSFQLLFFLHHAVISQKHALACVSVSDIKVVGRSEQDIWIILENIFWWTSCVGWVCFCVAVSRESQAN